VAGGAVAAVIFDFDGLLMATESTMLASWQYEWRQHGLELDTATFWADHGGDVSQERYRLLAQAVGPSYDQARSHARRLAYRDQLHASLSSRPAWAAGWTRPPRPGWRWRWPAARRSGGCATT
jgi:putative hydrolase of the HAD superfamily